MQAWLKHRPGRPTDEEFVVDLLGRVRDRRIKVRSGSGRVLAVDRFRLRTAADHKTALTDAQLDALPWQGAGADPAKTPQPTMPGL